MKTAPLFALTCLVSLVSLTTGTSCVMKQIQGTRSTGQSRMMDDTFAGQNACNPDDHTRPFIIEWDATDMSSFEAIAANDIVIVKYEGCTMRVLDECKNDSIRGSQGAYKPPEWTSGSLEAIDIHNEGELHAKLPLGNASLGGRVAGGERFHMEYFVAGTVAATRDAVFRDDIKDTYGCEDATHFVYGYNLGAFALGSANDLVAEVGVSVYGFGAGGSRSSGYAADKKGGKLEACQADSATEVAGCKTPIRVNLRKIRDGADPKAEAMHAPETDESLNAAGEIERRLDMSDDAWAHIQTAQAKLQAGDGPSCIAELDMHDALDPDDKSSDPKSAYSLLRAQCVMTSGMCDAGKTQARKYMENHNPQKLGPEIMDKQVDYFASVHCQGDSMGPRDQLLQALNNLQSGAYMTKKDSKFCMDNYKKIRKLLPKVKPRDDDDTQVINAEVSLFSMVPKCFERAGDCKTARKVMPDVLPATTREAYAGLSEEQRNTNIQNNFESIAPKCKAKTQSK